jgi:hypothetical protein
MGVPLSITRLLCIFGSVPSLFVFLNSATTVTADGKTKVGFEIEVDSVLLVNEDCTDEDVLAIKGDRVEGHKGDKWFLGLDTTPPYGPMVHFEYDLLIDLDEDELEDPIEEILEDLVASSPSKSGDGFTRLTAHAGKTPE